VKADKANALSDFNSGTGGFKDRDLYPFCFNIADGATAGAGTVKGKDVKTLKDAAGKRSIGIGARSSGARTAKRSAKQCTRLQRKARQPAEQLCAIARSDCHHPNIIRKLSEHCLHDFRLSSHTRISCEGT
jgi:hypothetical protein